MSRDASQDPHSPEFGRTWAVEKPKAALPECLGGVEQAEGATRTAEEWAAAERRIEGLQREASLLREATSDIGRGASELARTFAALARRFDRLVAAISDHRGGKLPKEWSDADARLYAALSTALEGQRGESEPVPHAEG